MQKSILSVREDINLKWVETVKEHIICKRGYKLKMGKTGKEYIIWKRG